MRSAEAQSPSVPGDRTIPYCLHEQTHALALRDGHQSHAIPEHDRHLQDNFTGYGKHLSRGHGARQMAREMALSMIRRGPPRKWKVQRLSVDHSRMLVDFPSS